MSRSPRSPSRVVREVATETAPPAKRATNLTLSPDALAKAERAADARGTSMSQLVDDLLSALPAPASADEIAAFALPVRRLLGAATGAEHPETLDRQSYREFLYGKYGATE